LKIIGGKMKFVKRKVEWCMGGDSKYA